MALPTTPRIRSGCATRSTDGRRRGLTVGGAVWSRAGVVMSYLHRSPRRNRRRAERRRAAGIVRSVPAALAVALVVAMVAALGLAVVAPAPDAAADWVPGPCTSADGVTVIVDFQGLGGSPVTRCALGPQPDGFAALSSAGFVVTAASTSPGFLCRIDSRPAPGSDPCVVPSPAAATWSYWTATRGRGWVYSQIGARNPGTAPPGSVQGWSFSDGSNPPPRPAVPDPIVATTTAAPVPTGVPAPGAPVPSIPAPGAASSPAAPAAAAPGPSAAAPPSQGASPAAPSGSAANGAQTRPATPGGGGPAGATTVPGGPAPAEGPLSAEPGAEDGVVAEADVLGANETREVEAADPTGDSERTTSTFASAEEVSAAGVRRGAESGGGSPVGTIVGVALIAAIGAAAVVVRRRRSPATG